MRRNVIDLALSECETAMAAGPPRLPRWVLVLAIELQQEQGRAVQLPAGPSETLLWLLDLQRAYLRAEEPDGPSSPDMKTPPGIALRKLPGGSTTPCKEALTMSVPLDARKSEGGVPQQACSPCVDVAERVLIEHARDGDRDAFGALYQRHANRVRAFVHHRERTWA